MNEAIAKAALVLCVGAWAYLCGCVNGAIAVSRLMYGDDIRSHGSGNAGLTNFYRTYGARHALAVIAADMLKAVLAISAGEAVFGYFLAAPVAGRYFSGLMCIVGHIFPAFYSFRGGKGILCSGTLLLMLDWRIALVGWGVFALMWAVTRYVSVGSLSAAVTLPVTTALVFRGDGLALVLAIIISLCVIWAHRENVKRLIRGEENRFTWKK